MDRMQPGRRGVHIRSGDGTLAHAHVCGEDAENRSSCSNKGENAKSGSATPTGSMRWRDGRRRRAARRRKTTH